MRKTHMTPQQLKEAMGILYGNVTRGLQANLARELHVTPVTVHRWVKGERAIPFAQAELIRLKIKAKGYRTARFNVKDVVEHLF